MKRIGLTPRLIENDSYFEIRECWDINWSRFVTELGYTPILISVNYSKSQLKELGLSCIIFTGGNDLSIIDKNNLSIMRDKFEEEVLEFTLESDTPLIGVCRGMQFIGSKLGSKLEKVSGHVSPAQELVINQDHPLSNCLKSNTYNSYHNYGIMHLGENWNVLAKASDGVLKAATHKSYKILCHMWHPQREEPFDRNHIELYKSFLRK